MIGYIYRIQNKINNKVYIGRTVNYNKRFNAHRTDLNNNSHINKHLQKAWNKYGEENFEFIIIDKLEIDSISKKEFITKLNDLEIFLTKQYDATNIHKGYNLKLGSYVTASKEIGEKISKKLTGRKLSPEACKAISEGKKGEKNSFYGKKHSDATKEKFKNRIPWNKGKKMPQTTGRRHSEEVKQRIRESSRGKKAKLTPEQVVEIFKRAHNGESDDILSKEFGVSSVSIYCIRTRRKWNYLTENL